MKSQQLNEISSPPRGEVKKLARALDGDEVVAIGAVAGRVGGNGAGNVVAVDLAVRQRVREFAPAAVGVRDRRAARRARGEAAIDAIAVGIVGDDEEALFRMSGSSTKEHSSDGGGRDHGAHGGTPDWRPTRLEVAMDRRMQRRG